MAGAKPKGRTSVLFRIRVRASSWRGRQSTGLKVQALRLRLPILRKAETRIIFRSDTRQMPTLGP